MADPPTTPIPLADMLGVRVPGPDEYSHIVIEGFDPFSGPTKASFHGVGEVRRIVVYQPDGRVCEFDATEGRDMAIARKELLPVLAAGELRALTLWQPWAWAILHAGKDIENRPWAAPGFVGRWIGLHAAARNPARDRGQQAILYTILACHETPGTVITCPNLNDLPYGALLGFFKVDGFVTESDSKWWSGPVGWRIGQVVALPEPIPCRGFQRLWRPPADVQERAAAQLMGDQAPGVER